MTSALRVVSAGGIGMIQDLGRAGMQRFGVPVSGALDSVSLRIANAVVGNADGTAGLEMFYQGPTLELEAESVRVASVGAPLEVIAGQRRRAVRSGRSVLAQARRSPGGRRLRSARWWRIWPSRAASRCRTRWAACRRSCVPGSVECKGGRSRKATRFPSLWRLRRSARSVAHRNGTSPRRPACAVVFGPQDDFFTARGTSTLTESVYTVSTQSDRIGMRLQGPVVEHAKGFDIVSDGTVPGSIQVPWKRASDRAARGPAYHRRLPEDRHGGIGGCARAGPAAPGCADRFRRHQRRGGGAGATRAGGADRAGLRAQLTG